MLAMEMFGVSIPDKKTAVDLLDVSFFKANHRAGLS